MSTPAPAPEATNSSRTGYGAAPSPLRGNAKSGVEHEVWPDLRPRFADLKGPFSTRKEVLQRVNDFTMDRSLCPAGTWKNRATRTHRQTKSRGEISQPECANCAKTETEGRKDNATFLYQVADEGKYCAYQINPDAHQPGWFDPARSDAAQRSTGVMHIPAAYRDLAVLMRKGF